MIPLQNRPLPTVTDDNRRFWESAKQRALELQKCDDCGEFRYYPTPICHFCGSDEFTWTPISGRGTIYSWSVLERAKGNPFEHDVPIAIVLVTLEEGPVMMSNLIDYEGVEISIGMPVTIDYGDVNDEITLPLFRPAPEVG